jgi:hypothetical protein
VRQPYQTAHPLPFARRGGDRRRDTPSQTVRQTATRSTGDYTSTFPRTLGPLLDDSQRREIVLSERSSPQGSHDRRSRAKSKPTSPSRPRPPRNSVARFTGPAVALLFPENRIDRRFDSSTVVYLQPLSSFVSRTIAGRQQHNLIFSRRTRKRTTVNGSQPHR